MFNGAPCGQEGEQNQADRYAELALQADRYNPAGLPLHLSVCLSFSISFSVARLYIIIVIVMAGIIVSKKNILYSAL